VNQQIDISFAMTVSYPVVDGDQLNELLSVVLKPHLVEVYLASWGRTLAIFKNGDKAFVMFLRFEGDAGFHTIDPNYAGPTDATLELYMKSGQGDEKPLGEWISLGDAKRAAEHFLLSGERAPWLTWYDDSQ